MEIYTHVSNPLAYVDPGLYQGLQYIFWPMAKNLALFGIVTMFGSMLAYMGRRHTASAEQKGEQR